MEIILDNSYFLNVLASIFLASSQIIYIVQLIRKKITPSVITWLGWTLLVGISFVSQLNQYGWNWVLLGHLFSGMGCTLIFLFSFFSGHYIIQKRDWYYLCLGIGCIVLYLATKNPWLTTIFSILADAILGIPTILKALKNPLTEKNLGWNLAIGCWSLTIITGLNKDSIFLIFPIYCLLFNILMSYLTNNKRIRILKGST